MDTKLPFGFLLFISLFQVLFIVQVVVAQTTNGDLRQIHVEGYCAMYDICGARSDGYGSPAVKPNELLSSKIQSLCPTITGNVCCTEAQFDTLRRQVQQAIPFLVGCPACLRNFLNLICELTCSPNQCMFIKVTSVSQLWVGPGSKAAEEKQFFDSNLSPFYRIEQLILATIPDALDGKSPSVVTEENIKLLFEIQKKIDGIRVNYSGTMISLTDICMKPMEEDCATQSVIQELVGENPGYCLDI